MATVPKKLPRATLRKILKAHTNKNIFRDVDALVYLDYVLFIQWLLAASVKRAKKAGEKRVAAKDIRMLTVKSLKAFKG
jgi:histone H3/H4